MQSSFFEDIDILGMDYSPGQLILVGGENWDMTHYVLSNCILEGLKDVPVLYFCGKNVTPVSDELVRLEAESFRDGDGSIIMESFHSLPVHFDGTDNPSVSYIIGRIFHMVETQDVGCVVVDSLQDILGGPLKKYRRESQLNGTLHLLKAVAEVTATAIIVLSRINYPRRNRRLSVDDLQEAPYVEEYCDQVILIDRDEKGLNEFILAKGLPGIDHEGEYVIKTKLFSDKQPFRKAGTFSIDGIAAGEDLPEISSLCRWINKDNRSWVYGFLDSKGTEWSISLKLVGNDEKCHWEAAILSATGDSYMNLFPKYQPSELEKLKSDALTLVRQMFPDLVL